MSGPPVSIDGGVGGEHARTEDLVRASAALRSSADRVRRVSAWAAAQGSARDPLWASPAMPDHAAVARARDAAVWVNTGGGGAVAVARDLDDLADDLAETVHLLEEAEHGSRGVVAAALRLAGDAREAVLAVGWIARHVSAPWTAALPDPVEDAVFGREPVWTRAADPALVEAGLGLADDRAGLARLATRYLASASAACDEILGDPHGLAILPVGHRSGVPPASVGDLVDRLGDLAPGAELGGEGSRIAVERVVHADGSTAVILEIPGTQQWLPTGGPNVFDATGDLRMMAGQPSDVTAGVLDALRQSEVGPNEPLMIVGHSEGGIAAMALAGTPAFSGAFQLDAVVTVGSPVAGFRPPEGTSVLSLENRTDLVPALDGGRNPDTADWITARGDLEASPDAADRGAARSFFGSHELDAYRDTAGEFDASPSPSAREWARRNSVFLGGDGATSTVEVYEVMRGVERGNVAAVADGRD